MSKSIIHKDPIPGVPIIAPEHPPKENETIVGYELIDPNPTNRPIVKPDPKRMNKYGWLGVIGCAFCFWPATCIPCFMSCSYSKVQRPIYG